MGCSLLSIVEIFYFITRGIWELISKCRNRNSAKVWVIQKIKPEEMANHEILTTLNMLKDVYIKNEQNNVEVMKTVQKLSEKYQHIDNKVSALMDVFESK
jgi:hypothetical protein